MKELADLAGVDVSTVSRALRGDTKRVAAATIERVQRLAAENGYVPHAVASSLRSGRSRTLGLVVPTLSDIVMGILVTAMDEAAKELGYVSTVVATHGEPMLRRQAVGRLVNRKVDGLVLCDGQIGHDDPVTHALNGVPYVYAMRRGASAASVAADDRRGGALVAEHFLELGHRAIAAVPGPLDAQTAHDRLQGFTVALHRHSVGALSVSEHGGFEVQDGHRYVHALLDRPERPTAIFCTNDHTAIGAGRAIADRGLKIGEDIALVGYNDIPQAAFLETPLSSVSTDLTLMGTSAVRQLVGLIEGNPAPGLLIEPTLVVRASSGRSITPG